MLQKILFILLTGREKNGIIKFVEKTDERRTEMDALWIMLKNVLVFVLLAVPGFILVKTKLFKQEQSGTLSALLTYVGMPFLVVSSTLKVSFSGEFVASVLWIAALGVAFTVLLFFLSVLYTRGNDEKRKGMERFSTVFSNSGFLGIPLAKAVFGDTPAFTYVVVLNIVSNVLMFTLGIYLVSGDKKNISPKKVLLNPVLLAFVLGIILNVTGVVGYVPEVQTYADYLSGIVTPLAMVILGIKMADVPFSRLFLHKKMYFVSFIKLIVVPVAAAALALVLQKFGVFNATMVLGFFLWAAMPTPGSASAFADQFGGDTDGAVCFTLGTTLLSIISIPVLYWVLCMLL